MNERDKKKLKKAIGIFLHQRRIAKDLHQDKLAKTIGVASSTISAIERGKVFPGFHIMMMLANELEFSLDHLADEVG